MTIVLIIIIVMMSIMVVFEVLPMMMVVLMKVLGSAERLALGLDCDEVKLKSLLSSSSNAALVVNPF